MRAAALAGLGLGELPGQLMIAGWIQMWGSPAILGRVLSVQEAARFTVLTNVYNRFQRIDAKMPDGVKKSRGIKAYDMLSAGEISRWDYELIMEQIESGAYKKAH